MARFWKRLSIPKVIDSSFRLRPHESNDYLPKRRWYDVRAILLESTVSQRQSLRFSSGRKAIVLVFSLSNFLSPPLTVVRRSFPLPPWRSGKVSSKTCSDITWSKSTKRKSWGRRLLTCHVSFSFVSFARFSGQKILLGPPGGRKSDSKPMQND